MKKIVFYDHNCKICTCFKNWAEKRSSYWEFLPNDEKSILDSGIDIDSVSYTHLRAHET